MNPMTKDTTMEWNPRIALHTWTLDTTPLEQAIAAAAQAGYDALELRRLDFERCHERGLSDEAVLDLVRAGGLPVCTLGVKYGWLFAQGQDRADLFDILEQSCRNAVALGCPQVMSAPGPWEGTLDNAAGALREACAMVAGHGLTLAIEFNSQHANINSVATLRRVIEAVDNPVCGYLLDAYHLHRSGNPGRGFEDVAGERIYAFQYSDCSANPVTGVKRPTDRLPPGQGVVDWTGVFSLLADKQYAGHLSYESPNPRQWDRPAAEVAAEGLRATRALIAQAHQGVQVALDGV